MQNLEIKSHKKSTKTTAETKTRSVRAPKTPLIKKLSVCDCFAGFAFGNPNT
ncbi:hypothetical protein DOY81_011379 [Sarcophaga bullata]|nr:hypothetical protein DOY81_011379 [Sarcophaga bullata]